MYIYLCTHVPNRSWVIFDKTRFMILTFRFPYGSRRFSLGSFALYLATKEFASRMETENNRVMKSFVWLCWLLRGLGGLGSSIFVGSVASSDQDEKP